MACTQDTASPAHCSAGVSTLVAILNQRGFIPSSEGSGFFGSNFPGVLASAFEDSCFLVPTGKIVLCDAVIDLA
ncbi:MAG: hypothetical protein D3924_09555 [Candidatus Electrothrix sp. AR4]|nr:hypothetical protein [Candidatus Electrothrix sp. AR4]